MRRVRALTDPAVIPGDPKKVNILKNSSKFDYKEERRDLFYAFVS